MALTRRKKSLSTIPTPKRSHSSRVKRRRSASNLEPLKFPLSHGCIEGHLMLTPREGPFEGLLAVQIVQFVPL